MTGFGALVRLYLADLARRRIFWAALLMTGGLIALNYWINRSMEDAVGDGESWDVATKQAASRLEGLAQFVRPWIGFTVVMLAAQLAPESRRNGTTQFLLSLGVRRGVLASAQYVALAIVLTGGVLIVHTGFAAAELNTASLGLAELSSSWSTPLFSALATAAGVFAVSLTASSLETYLLFLGVPLLCRTLPNALSVFPPVPLPVMRLVESAQFFFPEFDELITWPHQTFGAAATSLQPRWAMPFVHQCVATIFWVVLGLWLQKRHDFGSRTALK